MAQAAPALPQQPLAVVLRLDLDHIEAGVPLSALAEFVERSGIPLKDVHEVVIPARTLKHRRARRELLSRDESDKLARLVRVFDHAVAVFEDRGRALSWLSKPKKRFDSRTPLAMLRTELGGRMIEETLGQIEYGIFA